VTFKDFRLELESSRNDKVRKTFEQCESHSNPELLSEGYSAVVFRLCPRHAD